MATELSKPGASLDAAHGQVKSAGSLKFFLLTFAVTWICWIPIVVFRIPARTALRSVLLFVGIFAPALVALSLIARREGSRGVRTLSRRMLQWRVPAKWYLFALGYTTAIKLFDVLVYRLITGAWPRFGTLPLYLIPFGIAISTPVQSGEEIGWRGYALPRLAARFGLGRASILLGVIWACWHLPLFFVSDTDIYHQSFFIYVLQVTPLCIAMSWLWEHTGRSLLLTMLMHSAVNNTEDIFPSAVPGGATTFGLNASTMAWLGVAVLWLCAAYFLVRMSDIGPREQCATDTLF